MEKVLGSILTVLAILLTVTGCSSSLSAQNNPPKLPPTPRFSPPPLTLPSVDSLQPEEKVMTYISSDEDDLIRLGMPLPHQLSGEEKNRVIQIGLNAQPVSEKISQGATYRTEQIWMSYTKGYTATSNWSFHESIDQLTKTNPNIVFFPAAKIGLGTPQLFEVNAAVDLVTNKAVYVIRRPDKHVALPSYVKPLTEQDKSTILALSSEMKGIKNMGPNPKIDFGWVAISKSGGTIYILNKDIIEKGVLATTPLDSLSMTIYPMAIFDSSGYKAWVAVDLISGKIVGSDYWPA